MCDEEKLMKKLDELVLNGYGDALWYGCSIAANAAVEGYRKGEHRAMLTRIILVTAAVFSIMDIRKSIIKYHKSKDQIK